MYTIDQDIANQIAKKQTMKYIEMEKLFKMDEEEADKYEMDLRKAVEIQSDDTIARAVVAFLPLFLESRAITNYINQTKTMGLRAMMPEILTAEEAALMAQMDITMNDNQVLLTAKIFRLIQLRLSKEQNKG